MIDAIKSLLRAVWNFAKFVFSKVINFFKNVVGWFQDKYRSYILRKHPAVIAVAIKDALDSGEFQVVKCLYNTETNELHQPEEHFEVERTEQLDDSFKNIKTDLIIIR